VAKDPLIKIEKAKKRLVASLRGEAGFVGAGVSAGRSMGKYEITVIVGKSASPVLEKVPPVWEGFPVRTQIAGIPKKL
jgi:hypothetical protein